jgi:soluble lytic murein transglycosylase
VRYIKAFAPSYLQIGFDNAPARFWQLAFPLPYRVPLETYSRQNGVDPFFVAALIRQESEFNVKVISHAHAYGLMQVLPSTGRQLARQIGIRRFSAADLLTPNRNLQLGTRYVRQLLDSLNGHEEEALAAFNAGKSRVDRWDSWGPFREPAEFVETIPFQETRNYVQVVLRNAAAYRHIYANAPAAAAPPPPAAPASPAKRRSKPARKRPVT